MYEVLDTGSWLTVYQMRESNTIKILSCFIERVRSKLCHNCILYLTETKSDWSNAWPTVLYSILKERTSQLTIFLYFTDFYRIKFEISDAGVERRTHLHPVLKDVISNKRESEPLIIDITRRKYCFQRRIDSYHSTKLKNALDDEPFPSIRCPFGCFSFLKEDTSVSFQQLINYIFSEVTAFNASFYNHFRSMRKDFLTPKFVLDYFTVSAALKLNQTKGFQLHCCTEHNHGSGEQVIHPPIHPILKNPSPLHEERPGLLTPTLRNISCTKPKFSSHTYHLTRAVGNYSVVSSIRLSRNRRWDFTSEILSCAENVALNNRFEAEYLLRAFAIKDCLKDETIKEMYLNNVAKELKFKSLKSASRMNADSTNRLKNLIDLKNQSSSKIFN